MSRIIYEPEHHVCDGLGREAGGGWWYPDVRASVCRYEDGTIMECSCGKTWVAGQMPGFMPNVWRRESWWEKKRRIKKGNS